MTSPPCSHLLWALLLDSLSLSGPWCKSYQCSVLVPFLRFSTKCPRLLSTFPVLMAFTSVVNLSSPVHSSTPPNSSHTETTKQTELNSLSLPPSLPSLLLLPWYWRLNSKPVLAIKALYHLSHTLPAVFALVVLEIGSPFMPRQAWTAVLLCIFPCVARKTEVCHHT
jgi:hypothetical protein